MAIEGHSTPWIERVEERINSGKASWLDRWLWKHWLSPDSDLPDNSKAIEKAEIGGVSTYNGRAHAIASREWITPEEVTLRYFTLLDTYTRAKRQKRLGQNQTITQAQLDEWKAILDELFKGMRVETLTVAGKPFFFKIGYWETPSGARGVFRTPADVDNPENEAKWAADSIEDFLLTCGFKHAWE